MSEDLRKVIQNKFEKDFSHRQKLAEIEEVHSKNSNDEEIRKKLFLEERENFFKNKDGFIKIINNIGEEEWISKEELKKREGYLNFEEDVDDARTHQKKLMKRYFFLVFIILIVVGFVLYHLVESKGFVEVKTNVDFANIYVDGQLVGVSNSGKNTIEDLVTGMHTIKIVKSGYTVTPDSAIIEVFKNDPDNPNGTTIEFKLDSLIIETTHSLKTKQ
ncbi:MAG: hypothetical protein JXR48_13025 [Candidatus Delongbacteria bacterium]|nr:hypothetical protein [Candidatus Delongbacteria bacterium]MBN2835876.1 hypothetical protein [Candidatus Delongbacteria bacterium]